MNKTLLIFKHEFLRTIRRTGFIILALAMPLLSLLGIGVLNVVSGFVQPPAEVTKVGFVDEVGSFTQFTTQGKIDLVRFNNQEAAKQALIKKDVKDYIVISQDYISNGKINLYTLENQLVPPTDILSAVSTFLTDNLLAGKVSQTTIDRVESPLNLVTTTLTGTGEIAPQQANLANMIIPGVFGLLLALSLIFTSAYVIQSLSEEKENRLMEILLSSVSTRQLVTGKVLGLGAAGLLQVSVWVISIPLLLNLASSSLGGFVAGIQLPIGFLLLGVLYFILGYALFAVLSASVAAVSSTVQEAQGLASIYSMFNVAPFWFFSLLLYFPNSPVWVVFSIFPFTAPVLTMLRLGMTGVPAWEIIVSILVLILCIIGGLFLAAKLLRTYLLMYGKRPRLAEIIRSFRTG
jgi:ABC-2 type transport system permease protein